MRFFNDFIFYCAKFSVFFLLNVNIRFHPSLNFQPCRALHTIDFSFLIFIHRKDFIFLFSSPLPWRWLCIRRFPPIGFHLHITFFTNSSPLSNFSLVFKPRRLQFLIAIFQETFFLSLSLGWQKYLQVSSILIDASLSFMLWEDSLRSERETGRTQRYREAFSTKRFLPLTLRINRCNFCPHHQQVNDQMPCQPRVNSSES